MIFSHWLRGDLSSNKYYLQIVIVDAGLNLKPWKVAVPFAPSVPFIT